MSGIFSGRAAFLGLLAAGGVWALAAGDGARVVYRDAIAAVVDGEPITGHQIQEEIDAGQVLGSFAGGTAEENRARARAFVLDRMIEQEVLYREFVDLKARVPRQMVQERLDKMVLKQADGNLERFEDLLFRSGMTVSELKKKIVKRLAAEMLLYDRVQRDIQVPEPEVEDYYQRHLDRYRRRPRYRLAVIQLKKNGPRAGRLAETWAGIRAALAAGKSFAELARTYSEDPSAPRGGDLGWQEDLDERLLDVIRGMDKGQVAPRILPMSRAEYLIRLEDTAPGGVRPLEGAVREEIRNQLRTEKEKKRYQEYMAPLYRKYNVRRFQ